MFIWGFHLLIHSTKNYQGTFMPGNIVFVTLLKKCAFNFKFFNFIILLLLFLSFKDCVYIYNFTHTETKIYVYIYVYMYVCIQKHTNIPFQEIGRSLNGHFYISLTILNTSRILVGNTLENIVNQYYYQKCIFFISTL